MTYEITITEQFMNQMWNSPKKIQKAWGSKIYPRLEKDPATPDRSITQLEQNRLFWRYKQGDYRIIYKCDQKKKVVHLWAVAKREENTYKRLGLDRDLPATARIIANPPMHEEFGIAPNDSEQMQALAHSPAEIAEIRPARLPDDPLPITLNSTQLSDWNIPEKFHTALAGVKTGDDLLDADIPEHIFERVSTALFPPTAEDIVNAPRRVVPDSESMTALVDEKKSLEEFLLALDDEQKPFVKRFREPNPVGPWMVKGGPGSGKSTVALYCIKELAKTDASNLGFEKKRLRILFTTFTKSLITASKHLLESLGVDNGRYEIDAIHVDSLAARISSKQGRQPYVAYQVKKVESQFVDALKHCRAQDRGFLFSTKDIDFLFDEIDWVIIGCGHEDEASYLSADRTGRGRRLGSNQRKQIWALYSVLCKQLKSSNLQMPSERMVTACQSARPQYDYVFIDEAQDLKPVAIRLCIALAKNPKSVFVTADPNQTIYGANMPWKQVSDDLNFRGRSRVFKRNYRTTHEICEAIRPIIEGIETTDSETLSDQPVYHGEIPTLGFYRDEKSETDAIARWMDERLIGHGLLPGCAAVLCPTNLDCDRIAQRLPKRLNAKAFKTSDKNAELDLAHPGVKVLTMHSSKGLQFPVVTVTGLEKGKMPWNPRGGMDPTENDTKFRRLFFVACSRALKDLLVLGNEKRPSSFLDTLNRDEWNELD